MAGSPLVSVIMNCYNCARYLKIAIDSVYAQSYENWEIVFWDNASTDESVFIAKSYDERLKYYRSERNTSLGEARNCALSMAKGKYIAFLDCDDLYLADKLLFQIELLENSNYAMVYASAIMIDDKGGELWKYLAKNKNGYIFPNLLVKYEINMQSVMLRKAVLDRESLTFDSSLSFSPDYNLFMHIAAKFDIAVIKEPLVKYRILSNSLSKKSADIISSEAKFTLDMLRFKFPDLAIKYKKSFNAAYAKLTFYDSVSLIQSSNFVEARVKIRKIIFRRLEYLLLYLSLFLPLPKSIFLRLLKR